MSTLANPAAIFQAMQAFQQTEAFKAAVELDLFTAVAQGADRVESLAAACGTSPKGTRVLADAMTVMGMLEKQDGAYALAPAVAPFLDRRSPAFLGDAVKFILHAGVKQGFDRLADVVRRGGSLNGEGTVEPENPVWVDFARYMAPIMMPASQTIPRIIGPLAAGARVLDIAAGHGLFGIEVAKANPGVQVTQVDWRPVLEVAAENARRAGVADRMHALAGSAFEVEFGAGYDVALLTNFLHHFDAPTCEGLLKRLHAALKPGGRVVTLEFCPNEDRVTPPQPAWFAVQMLVNTRAGDAYTIREIDGMARNAGFAPATAHALEGMPHTVIISSRPQ
jgi:SAM-dependent methyltransferase